MNAVRRRTPHALQQGVALITVLLVVALATVLAVAMTSRQQLDIRRTGNLLEADQVLADVGGAEDWAVHFLAAQPVAANASAAGASEIDPGPWTLPPMPIEGGTISATLEDAQDRLNLNALVAGTTTQTPTDGQGGVTATPDQISGQISGLISGQTSGQTSGLISGQAPAAAAAQQARLQRLLAQQGLATKLLQPLLDWLDTDDTPRFPDGAEDATYLRATPAYRTADRPMTDASELLQVHGWSTAAWQQVAPYVTALPAAAGLNVNTAPAPVLRALAPGLDEGAAQSLVALRGKGFASLAAFRAALQQVAPQAAAALQSEGLTVTSRFYVLRTRVQVGRIEQVWQTLIARDGVQRARVISRRLAGF